jgi:hypothetical protein
MNSASFAMALIDNGGRRLGVDSREFSYTDHIPDRRNDNNERRSGIDRRSGLDRRSGKDRRSSDVTNIKLAEDKRKGKDRRNGIERRAAFAAALDT